MSIACIERPGSVITPARIRSRLSAIACDHPNSHPTTAPSLEHRVLPAFYHAGDSYVDVMRHAIALNGSFFNTGRMIDQYVNKAYFR